MISLPEKFEEFSEVRRNGTGLFFVDMRSFKFFCETVFDGRL